MKRILLSFLVLLFYSIVYAQTGTWSGQLTIEGRSLWIVFHISGDTCLLDVPDQGAKGIPTEYSLSSVGEISISIPSINASYKGLFTPKFILGTFSQLGLSLPLVLSPGMPSVSRPQTPVPPFPYEELEVSFRNNDIVLNGTLVVPDGASINTPAIILISGSGIQNRDEEVYDHKPFAVIADYLARNGIASLRYDDQGYGDSSQNALMITIKDYTYDALAGVHFLRSQFNTVGALGHSEGGSIAFVLATENCIDFCVGLAGMVVSGKQTLLTQNRKYFENAGLAKEIVDEYCRALSKIIDSIISEQDYPSLGDYSLPKELKDNLSLATLQMNTPYMKSFLSLDLSSRLRDVSCPVFAIYGTKDTQVDCTENVSQLETLFPNKPSMLTINAFEGLNHFFQHCVTGETNEIRSIEETISPEVLASIVKWIQQNSLYQEP